MRIEDVMGRDGEQPAPEDASVPPGTQEASAEEQTEYEKIVLAGMQIIYDDKMKDQVLGMVKSMPDDPAQAMAQVAQMIILQLDEKSGGTIPETVIIPAAVELLEHIGELADAAKIAKVDEPTLGRAGQILIMNLCQEYGVEPSEVEELLGQIPPEQMREMVKQQAGYAGSGPGAQRPQPTETAGNGNPQ